jgi:hypothetical protein
VAEALPARKTFGANHRGVNDNKVAPEQSNDPWLRRAKEAYDISTSFLDTNYRSKFEDSIRHFQNQHMAGSKYRSDAYKFRAKMFRPKTRSSVRQNEAAAAAAFFSQLETTSIEPEDDKDPMQSASAALRMELLNYRLSGHKQIPWFQICIGGMQDANVIGVVVSKQFWEYEEKKQKVPTADAAGQTVMAETVVKVKDRPDIKLYPIENVRFDPAAEWTDIVNTSPYWIALEPMRVGEVRRRMALPEGDPLKWTKTDDKTLLAARNASYDTTRQVRDGQKEDATDPRHSKALSDFDIVWVRENFMLIEGEEKHYYTLTDVFRLTEPRDLSEVYLHGIRPFVVGTCVLETHKPIPDSPVDLGKGLQKEINQVANSRLDNVSLVLNKRWLVRRGKQVDLQSLTRNAPASVTMVTDVEADIKEVEFQDVTASAYAEQDRLNVDHDELLGNFSQGSIQTNRKLNETVGGMNMIRGQASVMTQYLIRVFSETWVEKVLNHIDLLEQHYESDMRLLTLMAKRANVMKYGIQQVTKELLMQPGRVIVNVANSAMDPMIRLQAFTTTLTQYAEMMQTMPPDIDREKVKAVMFGLMGYRDGSQFSTDSDQNPQLQQAMQMIQQLQQALESKMQEIQAKNEAQFAKIQADALAKQAALQSEERMGQAQLISEQRMEAVRLAQEQRLEEMRLMQEDRAQRSQQEAEERQAIRDAQLQVYLGQLGEQTKMLVCQMQADGKQNQAMMAEDTKRSNAMMSEDTKKFAAQLQSNTDKAIAVITGKEMPAETESTSKELKAMTQAFEKIAQGMVNTAQTSEQIIKQLTQSTEALHGLVETLAAPRHTVITKTDSKGMPTQSESRIVK